MLNNLDLSWNKRLARPLNFSTPCAFSRFLSHLVDTASSSSLNIRTLNLGYIEMTAECCQPVLEEVLFLGSRGLEALSIHHDSPSVALAESLVEILEEKNRFIKFFEIGDSNGSLEWMDLHSDITLALESNRRLQEATHKAAFQVLRVARTLLLSSPIATPSEPSGSFHLPGLLLDLLPNILFFLCAGALSERQVQSIIRYVVDRGELRWPSREERSLDIYSVAKLRQRERRRMLEGRECLEYDDEV